MEFAIVIGAIFGIVLYNFIFPLLETLRDFLNTIFAVSINKKQNIIQLDSAHIAKEIENIHPTNLDNNVQAIGFQINNEVYDDE